MDSLASLALATEPPKETLLNRPPHSRDEYIISRTMVKHLGFMAIYQVIIIFGIIFAGEEFLPESNEWWRFNTVPSDYDVSYSDNPNPPTRPGSDKVFPGRLYDWEQNDLYHAYVDQYGPSRHFTIVFTAFVMMQIFNMINARKIHDEKNVFVGFFDNPMFLIIFSIILVLQVLISQFTADVFYVSRDGLSGVQWIICTAIGLSVFIVDFLIKFIPDSVCPEVILTIYIFSSSERKESTLWTRSKARVTCWRSVVTTPPSSIKGGSVRSHLSADTPTRAPCPTSTEYLKPFGITLSYGVLGFWGFGEIGRAHV